MKATEISGRLICSILDDMRECHKTQNYSYLLGLIEEAQYRANRMEDRLEQVHEFDRMERRYVEVKAKVKELDKKLEKENDV